MVEFNGVGDSKLESETFHGWTLKTKHKEPLSEGDKCELFIQLSETATTNVSIPAECFDSLIQLSLADFNLLLGACLRLFKKKSFESQLISIHRFYLYREKKRV